MLNDNFIPKIYIIFLTDTKNQAPIHIKIIKQTEKQNIN
jgi:hypothetical protein